MDGSALTELLRQAGGGNAVAQRRLLEQVYDELRRQAGSMMRRERPGHTLQPTALVHEAYMRLQTDRVSWENRAHFFGAAAEAMRRVLVEHARKRASLKRGGDIALVTFDELHIESPEHAEVDILAMHEALAALEHQDPRLANVAKLRFFVGLSVEETAEVLSCSKATVKRDWTFARAWLFDRMRG